MCTLQAILQTDWPFKLKRRTLIPTSAILNIAISLVRLLSFLLSLVSLSFALFHLSIVTRGLFRCLFFPAQTIFGNVFFFSTIRLQVCTDSTLGVQKGEEGVDDGEREKKRTKGKVKPVSQSPFCSAVSGEETSARLTLSHKHTHSQSNAHLTSPRGRFLPHRCPELSKQQGKMKRERESKRKGNGAYGTVSRILT